MILPTRSTITEGVRATKSISTCSHLLAIAGLDELLRGEGDYTLFAPTDQAFDNLPPGVLSSLQADPAKLRDVLEYHILSVGRELSQLRNGKLATLQGALITASVTDDGMQIDHASTRGQPMRCSNGMIHQIDAVLFPGFTRELSATATKDSAWSGRRRERITTAATNATSATSTTSAAVKQAEAAFEMPAASRSKKSA